MPAYVTAQVTGCVSGAVLANVMFDADAVSVSTTERATFAHGVSEVVATTRLLLVIFSLARSGRVDRAPAAFIGAQLVGGVLAMLLIRVLVVRTMGPPEGTGDARAGRAGSSGDGRAVAQP